MDGKRSPTHYRGGQSREDHRSRDEDNGCAIRTLAGARGSSGEWGSCRSFVGLSWGRKTLKRQLWDINGQVQIGGLGSGRGPAEAIQESLKREFEDVFDVPGEPLSHLDPFRCP